jgi:hypothetical protein
VARRRPPGECHDRDPHDESHRRLRPRGRGLTEQAVNAAIDSTCRALRLPRLRSRFGDVADAAKRQQLTYRGFLADPTPPAGKQHPRRGTLLDQLQNHINALLEAEPDLASYCVWQRLIDEHHAEISYSTLRDHLAKHRQR